MLFYTFYLGSVVLVALGTYCWLGVKKYYDKGEMLPFYLSIAVWILSMVHILLVILSATYAVWPLPFNKTIALIVGFFMFGVGIVTLLIGMFEFRSFRKVSGLDTSRLITTGIYRWSRNPQHVGWFLILLGISFIGRSGLAFLFTIVGIAYMHLYTIWMEEPYLERIFGEEYRLYKSRTARYIRIPKRRT